MNAVTELGTCLLSFLKSSGIMHWVTLFDHHLIQIYFTGDLSMDIPYTDCICVKKNYMRQDKLMQHIIEYIYRFVFNQESLSL